jgi:hypothetical protein
MSLFGELDVRLEPWDVEYGSETPLEAPEEAFGDTVALDIELPENEWRAVGPAPTEPPQRLVFVDGVRRVEARLIVRRNETLCRGAFGSYAVGCTVVAGGRAEIVEARVHRLVVLGSGESFSESIKVMPGLVYQPQSTASADIDGPLQLIQQRMLIGEERLGREMADETEALVVVDGPLTFGEKVRGEAVGYVKRLHRLYLDRGPEPGKIMKLLFELPKGMRTPLFALRSSKRFARYCWFLRLAEPHRGESPLSGLVRLEVSETVGLDTARRLADATSAALPAFAPARGKDPRAPQNLLPIGALESRLRRQLGDARLIRRHISSLLAREAVHAPKAQ